jgi:hypothetical protein
LCFNRGTSYVGRYSFHLLGYFLIVAPAVLVGTACICSVLL